MDTTAGIVTVGNELLSGAVENSNASWLARELLACGIVPKLILTLPDEVPAIARALREVARAHPYVFVTGGLGPTPDDVTREAVAEALERPLVEHPIMVQVLSHLYRAGPTPPVLAMARLPKGAELLSEDGRIFPGFLVENLYVFPGIPELMQANFALVKPTLKGTPFHSRSLTTALDETRYAELLAEAQAAFPEVLFGSYPKLKDGRFTATVTLRSRDAKVLDEAWAWLTARWPE
ncbi:MAG: competence/damage-inducible protein A [Candidatus Tectimicrobiota bacterium]